MFMRTTVLVSSVLLGASLLAGCGDDGGGGSGSSSSDYCDSIKAAKSDFKTFGSNSPDFGQVDKAMATFHKLADNAPAAVEDDWKVLDGALSSVEKVLADAGLTMEDLAALTAGTLPEGMTAQELQELGPKLQSTFSSLDSDTFKKASENIEKHAKSECDVDLTD
jgi:hypothetical protein